MLWLVPHLFASPRLLEAALPGVRLPGLSTLLARGRPTRESPPGTEAALARACGVRRQTDWPLAPITLLADGGAADGVYWLRADPAHFAVMRDRVVYSTATFDDLTHDEARQLTVTLAEHFGPDFAPQALHPRRWYLRLDTPPRLLTTPPSLARGQALDRILPGGGDATVWRARLNEAQMLLHSHPVNAAREARGQWPVNGLWLWGGGVHAAPPPAPVEIHAGPAGIDLARICGATPRPRPARFEPGQFRPPGIVLLDALEVPALHNDALGWRNAVGELEAGWFGPLARALRQLGPGGIRIADPVSGRGIVLRRGDAWMFWRRPSALASALA
ncbi:MAG: hypothetical protein ACK4R8_00420 [Thiobacillus sp.]